jgi:predicted dehydrogenase
MQNEGPMGTRGFRRVIIGAEHPYVGGGLPMAAPGVGLGQNEGFAYQARAFLEEVAGIDEADSLPRCASFDEGVHNMEVLAAVAESAAKGGASVQVTGRREMAAQAEAVAR